MAVPARSMGRLAALTAIALVIRLLLTGAQGQQYDLAAFAGWAVSLAHQPPWEFHSYAGYPPGYFVILLGVGRLYAFIAAHGGDPHATLLRILVKLPPVVADVACAWLAGAIARCLNPRFALAAAAAWLFNPVGIIDSAYWGQIDSVAWAPALAALWLLLLARREPGVATARYAWTWVAFGSSLLIKPQAAPLGVALIAAVVFAPPLARRSALTGTLLGLAGATCIGWFLAALFSGHIAPGAVAAWGIHELSGSAGTFSFTSANAFNLWSVALPFYVSDAIPVAGVALSTIGVGLVAVAVAAALWRFATLRTDRAVVELAALCSLATFILSTRMHERYVEGAVMLTIALIGSGRRWVAAAIVLTCTTTVNLVYALLFSRLFDPFDPTRSLTTLNVRDLWPLVAHPLSLLNVVLFFALLYGYVRAAPVRSESGSRVVEVAG